MTKFNLQYTAKKGMVISTLPRLSQLWLNDIMSLPH